MNREINYLPLVLSLILVNAAGFILRYFQVDTYIILLGFRFHISLILPFLICFFPSLRYEVKNYFIISEFKGWFSVFVLTLIPLILIIVTGYLRYNLDLSDPEYFYEFGLSTIVDYPVYLIWNFPQLAALFITLKFYSGEKKIIIKVFLLLIILFSFEFIPLAEQKIKYIPAVSFAFSALIASVLISKIKSIYLFAIIIFTMLWLNFLAFGCDSQTITNIIFARQYNSWEGFFSIDKKVTEFILPAQLLLTFLILLSRLLLIRQTKS